MKKLVLLLVISLGLVSVANAESVCNSYSIKNGKPFHFGSYMSYFATGNWKQEKYWDELVMRYYTSEIKKSDKETLCIYMGTTRQGYLNTQLTPQDIERFERFLVEKVDSEKYRVWYEEEDGDKDSYLKVLKFFKYYNKLDILYNKKDISIGLIGRWGLYDPSTNSLDMIASALKFYENEAVIVIKRFVYGKDMGSAFCIPKLECPYHIKDLKKNVMDSKDAKPIAKWAESKLKEVKNER